MKITKQDYDRLNALITKTVTDHEIHSLADYPGMSVLRYSWDIYHAVCDRAQNENNVSDYLFLRHLYDYLNDDHLTTALRAILLDLGKIS